MAETSALLPDPRVEKIAHVVRDNWMLAADELRAGSSRWAQLLDSSMQALFDTHLREAGASEGSMWVLDADSQCLVPVHNNGPQAAKFVGQFKQPLDRGLISTVFATQSGICESWVYDNPQHDPAANKELAVLTVHMIAVPLYFGGETRGVLSAVKLRGAGTTKADDPEPFSQQAMQIVRRLSFVLGELVDARIMRGVVGMR